MSNACSYNTVSCSPAELADFAYTIPADISTAPTTLVNTVAATCSNSVTLTPSSSVCVLTEALEIYDAANNMWEVYIGDSQG